MSPKIRINHSTELARNNLIEINKSKPIFNNLDWIYFQLSESVFMYPIKKLKLTYFGCEFSN